MRPSKKSRSVSSECNAECVWFGFGAMLTHIPVSCWLPIASAFILAQNLDHAVLVMQLTCDVFVTSCMALYRNNALGGIHLVV